MSVSRSTVTVLPKQSRAGVLITASGQQQIHFCADLQTQKGEPRQDQVPQQNTLN